MNIPELSIEERILGLSQIWKEAAYNFAHFDQVADLDWDKSYQEYLPKVMEAESLYDYYRLLQKFTAQLQDAHSSVYLPEVVKREILAPAIELQELDGKYYIINLDESLKLRLSLYSELISINGHEVKNYLAEFISPYIAASTPHGLKHWTAQDALLGKKGSKLNLLLKSQGEEKSVEIVRERPSSVNWIKKSPKLDEDLVLLEREAGIYHLQINNFSGNHILQAFQEHLPQLYSAKAIILDLRFNLGGNSQIAQNILKYFTDQHLIPQLQGSSRKHLPSHKALGSFLAFQPETDWKPTENDHMLFLKYYQGRVWELEENRPMINDLEVKKLLQPILVLVGPDTASASEDFLISFQSLNRGKLMGSKTCGSTGSAIFFKLPGGGMARICARKCTYPDSREFVGYGIEPDIEVKPGLEELKEDDFVLRKGVEYLIRILDR